MPEIKHNPAEKDETLKKSPEKKSGREFKDLAEAEAYLDWKENVPREVRSVIESSLQGKDFKVAEDGLPLTSNFLEKLLQGLRGATLEEMKGADKRITNLLKPLFRVSTKGGYINIFETLANPDASWGLRKRIYETQLRAALNWLVEQDLKELAEKLSQKQEKKIEEKPAGGKEKQAEQKSGQKRQESEETEDSSLPPENEEAVSSMETGMEKQEGKKAKAIFTVAPFYGGYYKQFVYQEFDPVKNTRWQKAPNEFLEAKQEELDNLASRILQGKVRGRQELALPLPYNWGVDLSGIKIAAPVDAVKILKNQDGQLYLKIEAEGIFDYQIKIAPRRHQVEESQPQAAEMAGDLPEELEQKIAEFKKSNLPRMRLLRELVKFIRDNLKYSNNPEAWQKYVGQPQDFFKKIWQKKEADCYVANTLAVRVLKELEGRVRFVGGHFVKEKNDKGEAVLNGGNGHAWMEVWDALSGNFVRLDATPKGDPNLDEEQQEKDLSGDGGEGDYGDNEMMSEEDVKKKIEEMKKEKGAGGKGNEKSRHNLEDQTFADLAGCTPEQARQFLNALERVRQIKDETGRPITDLLKEEWKKIVMERKKEMREYRGPVRMDEGDRLEDVVSAKIDIKSREFNPTGFERDERVEKIETDFGGLNIYFSFDLSGSMGEPDAASGRSKADVQRDVALLFVDSLMQCAYLTRREGEKSELLPIKIMVTLASNTGQIGLPLTDRWGAKEQWAFYTSLIRLASGGTPTHETLSLIEKSFKREQEELKKKQVPKEKLPVHYVAEITDGSPDDFSATEAMHKKLKNQGAAIRSYCIGGTSKSADASLPLQSFSQLPKILSSDIIDQFKKLNPRRIKF